MKKVLFPALLMLCTVFLFTECNKDDSDPEYTVTFDSQGGSQVSPQKVSEGQKVNKPTDPTKEGLIFVNWYKEAAGTNVWNFDSDVVNGNITLYAKWATKSYTVTFNTNGGSSVAPQTVAEGGTAVKPLPPTKDGSAFDGWYKETALTNLYDFSTVVTSDITVYAKWTAITAQILQDLINECFQINASNYTSASYDAMAEKRDAAQQVLEGNPTSAQIVTAYTELAAAVNALVELPHRATADLDIYPEPIDGIVYINIGNSFSLNARGVDANGSESTISKVTFSYSNIEEWAVDGAIQKGDYDIHFEAKSDLTAGATKTITVSSAEVPTITKTITLKVAAPDELKTLFINLVNSLPDPTSISYDHYETIQQAYDINNSMTFDDQNDPGVVTAYNKLQACDAAYEELPERYQYSFTGNVCNIKILYGNQSEPLGNFNYVANGTFPAGTYTSTTWMGAGENFYQYKLELTANGTAASSIRTAQDANGTGETAWTSQRSSTYTNEGTQQSGGIIYITYQD